MAPIKRKVKTVIQIVLAITVLVSVASYGHRLRSNDEIAQLGAKTFTLVKTGVEVMDKRVPVHLANTFKWFPNHAIYAEVDTPILGHPVVNAISYLPIEAFEDKELSACLVRYREIDEQWGWGSSNIKVNGKNIGWYVDVFKNVPAYAHAWLTDPTKDWYLMLDDDTFMLPSTLATAIEGLNPDDVIYLGRNIGKEFSFAYGGSGYVFSRGAMKATFGTTKESTHASVLDSMHLAYQWCCGDGVICELLGEKSDKQHYRDYLEFQDDSGLFQGSETIETMAAFRHWCEPIGSFHHNKGGDNDKLARWYEKLRIERGKNYRPTHFDFYEEFIMPHVAEEIEDWGSHHHSSFGDRAILEEVSTKDECKQICTDDEMCFQWSFRESNGCTLTRNGICAGKAVNKYMPKFDGNKSTAGYMVSRIKEHRRNPDFVCDPILTEVLPEKRQEGWLARLLENGPIPPKMNSLLDL